MVILQARFTPAARRTDLARTYLPEAHDADPIPDAAAADAEDPRMGRAARRRLARTRRDHRRGPGAGRAVDRGGRGCLRHDPARPIAPGGAAQMAAGATGRTAGWLLLSRTDRASARDHQFPRNLQRPYRRACDGLCAGLRPRAATLHSAAADAANGRMAGAETRGLFTCRRR